MENYIVSARKYRPTTFESVVGQEALTTTLKNAIATGKLAQAYLFCGPRGVGKTTCARIFAKTINCLNPREDGEACNECESCQAFNEQRSYNIFELDAASNNSVDNIRQLVEQVHIPPQIGKYKVYIIDEVHMLSTSAFNAFLKTLEEPPRHAIFILATTEKHKILPTILSRCQIYDFNRISVEDIVAHLARVAAKEGIHAEPEALNVIALKADGGMRDALSIFDQVTSFTRGNITYQQVIENLNVLDYEYYFKLTDHLLAGHVTESLLLLNDVLNKGFDAGNFITGLGSHFRDVLVSKDESTTALLQVGASIRERYKEQARKCPLPFLYKAMKLCNDCDLNYRLSKNKRFLVELTLIQLAQLTSDDEDPASGRGPATTIKPIFSKQTAQSAPQGVSAPASAPTAPAAPQQTAQKAVPPTPEAPKPQTHGSLNFAQVLHAPERKVKTVKDLSTLSISIKPQRQAETQTPAPAQPVTKAQPTENQPIDLADLRQKWIQYANSLPVEQIAMTKKMLGTPIALTEGTKVQITVDNKLAAQDFLAMKPALIAHLQKELHNSALDLEVVENAVTEQPKAFTRTERFQLMAEKNHVLVDLKDEFNLEFSV